MKILVGYDGSKVADHALSVALKHAKVFKADVIILTSLEQSSMSQIVDIDNTESKLEQLKRQFTAEGISCETLANVCYQSPGEDIVRFAEENDIDQIIIGVKKRSRVGKLLLGSNANYIIIEATCPVLAVK